MSGFRKKEEIRRKILSVREGLGTEEISSQSRLVTELFLVIPEFVSARSVLFYAALKGEVQTVCAINKALKMGKKVFLPKILDEEIHIFNINSYYGDTEEGAFHIQEPVGSRLVEAEPKCMDMVVVPGVGFDKNGNRLGFGKGYYDRFLTSFPIKIPFVGLAFEFQIMDEVSATKNDIPMDIIVTDKRIIDCRN